MESGEFQRCVEQAQQGDQAAFNRLFAATQRRVLFRCCGLLKGSREEGEEATQQVFLKVWKDLPRLQTPLAFTSWLEEIIRHTCLDRVRSKQYAVDIRSTSLNALAEERGDLAMTDPDQDVEERVVTRLELRELMQRIGTEVARAKPPWNADDKELFLLIYQQGYSFPQASARMKIPVSTLKSRHTSRIRPVLERINRGGSLD